MQSLAVIRDRPDVAINGKTLAQRAAGVFYTHELIGIELAKQVADVSHLTRGRVSILDPFGGDGRLVQWVVEELVRRGIDRLSATVWEVDPAAAAEAASALNALGARLAVDLEVQAWSGDSFQRARDERGRWQIVVTNPPWELLKPDRREIAHLPEEDRSTYVAAIQDLDEQLRESYPEAEPRRRFAGWGMNLSRAGTSIALRLTEPNGVSGVVCPASLFADSSSGELRRWIFEQAAVTHLNHYPAEARLFRSVDVPCCSFVAIRDEPQKPVLMGQFQISRAGLTSKVATIDKAWLDSRDYSIPIQYGPEGLSLLRELDLRSDLEPLGEYQEGGLWLGREIDETRRARFLKSSGNRQFIRSRHVHRLGGIGDSGEYLDEDQKDVPASADRLRIAWRDISRPSQRRRIHATILQPGPVTGNSVGVGYLRAENRADLLALLGLITSIPFEFQVRAGLMTNHISASAFRLAKVPRLEPRASSALAEAVAYCLKSRSEFAVAEVERLAADAYGLNDNNRRILDSQFNLLDHERAALVRIGGVV